MAILTPMFLLAVAVTSTHADIVWDGIDSMYLMGGPPRTSWTMNSNGAEFLDLSIGHVDYILGITPAVNNTFAQQNVSVTESTYPSGASAYMESRSYGSLTPNGANNYVASILEHSNFQGSDAIVGKQQPKADIRRNFYVTSDMTVTISGTLSGSINFTEQNYDWTTGKPINALEPYYGYTITAKTELYTFSKTMGLISADPIKLEMNNNESTQTATMALVADPDIYYLLRSDLYLDAKIKNNDAYYQNPVPLGDKVFEIGDWDANGPLDPLMLTSTITPLLHTPVPGSVLLLISGLAGLFTARRRLPGKPGVS
jgi:hypothetical protein